MRIAVIVGARPNFVKIAPIVFEIQKAKEEGSSLEYVLINTGQHYDRNMCDTFFEDLGIPHPHFNLEVGSGSHAEQTALVMTRFEKVCLKDRFDLVLVVGDVNSTMACALVAAKLGIPVAHVEAGLRSFDRSMPEEINRIVTDSVSDYFFTTCKDGDSNLIAEGVPGDKIFFVGNVMVDSLFKSRLKAGKRKILDQLEIPSGEKYALVTIHRPSNCDDEETFKKIAKALDHISKKIRVIFPVHPRTLKNITSFGLGDMFVVKEESEERARGRISLIEPVGYLDFMNLMMNAKVVLTDSGGIQEETTALGVPCVTIRKNTERPVTVTHGTNILAGTETEGIIRAFDNAFYSAGKKNVPELWDGYAARRIVDVIKRLFSDKTGGYDD